MTANSVNSNFGYEYDAHGLVTSKTKNVEDTEVFSWDTISGSIPLLLEDSKNEYIYGADNTPFAQINKETDEITYLYGDERNSVVTATNDVGETLWNREYSEYGQLIKQTGGGNAEVAFGYAGEYLDKDIGLYNLRARWYETATSSFINVDPAISLTGESYSYGSGNPLSNTDPLGLWSMSDSMTSVAGVADGLLGFPAASTMMNKLSPGLVNNCSAMYAGIAGVVGVGSLFIPGLGAAKVGLAVAKAATVTSKTVIISTARKPLSKIAEKGLTTEKARADIIEAAKRTPSGGEAYIYLRTDPLTRNIYVGKSNITANYKKR